MIQTLITLLSNLISKILEFVQDIFEWVFGDIDFTVLWNWLPADIQAAAEFLILILFGLVILKLIKSLVPFW